MKKPVCYGIVHVQNLTELLRTPCKKSSNAVPDSY